MKSMMEQLIPEDSAQDDTEYHRNIRRLTETTDDKEFTQDEVRQIIERFNPRKAPGPDGIISEMLTLTFKTFPKLLPLFTTNV